MSCLGRSLDNLLNKCQNQFSINCICNIADQTITRLEKLHRKNMLHRDIKPENFVIGAETEYDIVHIIDFGLSKYYRDVNGAHIKMNKKKGMIGTARYASLSAHLNQEQSCKDDIESLGYVLLYLSKGRLPWQTIYAETKKEKYAKIKNLKQNLGIAGICEGYMSEFVQYFEHCKAIKFDETPNYTYLRQLFKRILQEKKIQNVIIVDWANYPDYKNIREIHNQRNLQIKSEKMENIQNKQLNPQKQENIWRYLF